MRVKPHALEMVAEGVLEPDTPILRSLEDDQTQYLVPHDLQVQCDGPFDNVFYCLRARALSPELIVRNEFGSSNCGSARVVLYVLRSQAAYSTGHGLGRPAENEKRAAS